ncbi:MAG: aldo/keto reductase [Ilumatobacteraceae bacterium]|jgi:1-deoxyxylulose-5-phosphate synthase|nr:aldo/keto reductase [Ilumatobacteraceae bacterium]MDP4701904.1 aldo/keto reductase [Ilumatobacteraceae bacterium]MDP5108631.1 aldo/keto reductase [Ilumatobacteraceae bacterium]
MEHVRFGKTGMQVSKLCLGTMTFGYQCNEEQSVSILNAAKDHGFTFIDTADVYPIGDMTSGYGATEEILGRWLTGQRDNFILATKCYAPTGPNKWDQGNSRKNIIRAAEESLRRLKTDYIDLYQLHFYDDRVSHDESLSALDDLVRSGKVRYIGCSNYLAYQLATALGRSDVNKWERFASVQPRYNMLFRENERELLPLCAEQGLAVIPYNPLAGGFLTGKHQKGAPTADTRFTIGGGTAERYQERYWQDQMFATLEALRGIAAEADMTVAQLAIAWQFTRPTITSPIIGASKPEQLVDAVNAVRTPLSAELTQRLDVLTHEYRYGDSAR